MVQQAERQAYRQGAAVMGGSGGRRQDVQAVRQAAVARSGMTAAWRAVVRCVTCWQIPM